MDPIGPLPGNPVLGFFQENSLRCLNNLWERTGQLVLEHTQNSSLIGRVWRIVSSNKNKVACVVFTIISVAAFCLQKWRLKTFPEPSSVYETIRSLNLSRKNLSNIPENIQHCFKLTDLNLSYNKISSCPDWFSSVRETIRVLNLSHNNLSDIPENIQHCSKLTDLNLSHNKISSCPDWLFKLAPGARVDLRGNAFPEEELRRIQEKNQDRLRIQLSMPSQEVENILEIPVIVV